MPFLALLGHFFKKSNLLILIPVLIKIVRVSKTSPIRITNLFKFPNLNFEIDSKGETFERILSYFWVFVYLTPFTC
ncbi:hypothetical protein DR864_02550 [Runella rosea]|uniref:Uncharacterized protein n=1 Tax=Runella rosea TaxID=2259595 RepID=A0A344TDG6_9BACT|nr:hypothetical protein DR864_02550 [Runella rosea]